METLFKDFIIRRTQSQDTNVSIATNKMMLTCVKIITILTNCLPTVSLIYLIYIHYIRRYKITINKIVQLHTHVCVLKCSKNLLSHTMSHTFLP